MKLHKLRLLSILVGGLFAGGVTAQESGRLMSRPTSLPNLSKGNNPNQTLADRVAKNLRGSGLTKGANLSIVAINGQVHLRGSVPNVEQRGQIETFVRKLNGVSNVSNELLTSFGGHTSGGPAPGGIMGGTMGGPIPGPMVSGPVPGSVGAPGAPIVGAESDPAPVAPPLYPTYDQNPPKMPPYAWPTYAPYNNFSRVGYPLVYPYNAWPFIGPFYPFPKVPLGWRKVSLEWEDGHWYYGRHATPQDYWHVRFW